MDGNSQLICSIRWCYGQNHLPSSLKAMTGKEEASHQEQDESKPRPGEDWKNRGGSQQNSLLPSLLHMNDRKNELRIILCVKIFLCWKGP